VSVFDQVTIVPSSTVTGFGMKHELVSSHPGVDDHGAFVLVTS